MSGRDARRPGRRQVWLAVAILALAALGEWLFLRRYALGSDLKAVWLAGQFWSAGHSGQVYPADMGIFTMYPPSDWIPFLRSRYGDAGAVFPYLYPPLWAALSGWLTGANFGAIAAVALPVNLALLSGTVWLAMRASGGALSPPAHVALAALMLGFTPIGALALLEAQPHILVSFLLVATVERSRAGAQATAGAALALAAALKLFPAAFALFFLARGERRALMSFAVAGLALAGASVALAGWPLHRAFLAQISTISDTVFVTRASITVEAVLAQLTAFDRLTFVPSLHDRWTPDRLTGWFVMPRPESWRLAGSLALIAGLGVIALAFRRADADARATGLWPLAFVLAAVLAPIGWIYYLIPVVVFLPALFARVGPWLGGAIVTMGSLPAFLPVPDIPGLTFPFPVLMLGSVLLWALGFALAARSGRA